MLIGIISDTHDNLRNVDKALFYFKQNNIDTLIHAGDLSKSETLEYIAQNFSGQIYIVGGNSDYSDEDNKAVEKKLKNISYDTCCNKVTIDGLKIGIVHKNADALKFSATGKFDLIIHGHDHKPWQSFFNKTEILNPGNIADTRFPATLAVYDTATRKPRLIQLDKILSPKKIPSV